LAHKTRLHNLRRNEDLSADKEQIPKTPKASVRPTSSDWTNSGVESHHCIQYLDRRNAKLEVRTPDVHDYIKL